MGKISPSKALKKRRKKEQGSREARGNAFLAEYRELSQKHGMDFVAELQFTPSGITPTLKIREAAAEEPKIKPWSEAKRENLEIRKACKHEKAEDADVCRKCGLAMMHWGKDGIGATEEYVENTEKAIKEIEEQEKQNDEELKNAKSS